MDDFLPRLEWCADDGESGEGRTRCWVNPVLGQSAMEGSLQELKWFERATLAPKRTGTVEMELPARMRLTDNILNILNGLAERTGRKRDAEVLEDGGDGWVCW